MELRQGLRRCVIGTVSGIVQGWDQMTLTPSVHDGTIVVIFVGHDGVRGFETR